MLFELNSSFWFFSLNHFRFLGDKLSTAGLWKPQFRCPEEDIAEIFLWKKRFSHYFRKKVTELSHFRQKNSDRLAKKGLHVPGETIWGTILFLKLFHILNFFVIWAQDSQLFSESFQAVLSKPPNAWLKNLSKEMYFWRKMFFFQTISSLLTRTFCALGLSKLPSTCLEKPYEGEYHFCGSIILSLNLGFLAKTNQQYSQKCVSNVQKKSWGKKVCLKEKNIKTFLVF